jgi:hypothetical protein
MMLSSSGEAVGRYPSWSSRVKKSVHWVSGFFVFGLGLGMGRTIPGFVAVVFGGRVAFEAVVELVGCS